MMPYALFYNTLSTVILTKPLTPETEQEMQEALQDDGQDKQPDDSPPEMEQEIQKALQDLAIKRRRPVLCFCGDMDTESVQRVRSIAPQLKVFDKLSVLLDSPGGYIEDAYRIILTLREYAQDIEVLVPQWAKSAATFFSLSANIIYIGQYGELGPLDPQRLNLQGSLKPVSALESFKALDQLLKYSMDSLDGIVQNLLMNAPMDVPYAIEHAQPLFAAIVSPLYSQVDPHELGESGRSLAISEEYAMRVMRRWGYTEIEDNDRWQIARRLTWDYPTHGFVIDLVEAQQIGLNAERLDNESDKMCWKVLDIFNKIAVPDYIGIEIPPQEVQCKENRHDNKPKGEKIAERSPDGKQNSV